MSSHTRDVATAFSGHKFQEAYDHLAPDVVWVGAGGFLIEGRDGVIETCEQTDAELAHTTTEFTRFLVVADDQAAVVDAIGRYTDREGEISVVSSCDVYEFRGDLVTQITSYTVELEPPA